MLVFLFDEARHDALINIVKMSPHLFLMVKPMLPPQRTVYTQLVEIIGKLSPSEADIHMAQSIFNKFQRINAAALLEASIIEGVTPQVYRNIQKIVSLGFASTSLNQRLSHTQNFLKSSRLDQRITSF